MVADLIQTPGLARVYTHADRYGPLTVAGLVDDLGIPQGTAYDYVQRLGEAGLLT
jgi:Sugar-specific transcriptional regulator TrmB.